jgi:hypothetical protein
MIDVLSGADTALTFNLADAGVTPVSATYRIRNVDGSLILGLTDVVGFDPTAAEVVVSIPGVFNELQPGELFGARTIELLVVGDGAIASTVHLTQSYRLITTNSLVSPINSFLTLTGAEVVASTLVQVPAWLEATDQQKTAALIDAHRRLCGAAFKQEFLAEDVVLSDLSPADFNLLDAGFRSSLQIAQVVQAVDLMTSTEDQTLREAGVLQIKSGESSRTFRAAYVRQRAVCDRARIILSRYLASRSIKIGRA